MSEGDCCSDRWGLVARCSSRVEEEEEGKGGGRVDQEEEEEEEGTLFRIVYARGAIPNEEASSPVPWILFLSLSLSPSGLNSHPYPSSSLSQQARPRGRGSRAWGRCSKAALGTTATFQ
jgi:hypothetical protein